MPAPRLDPTGLEDRIRSTIAEIAALDAQAKVIATKRAAHNAEVCRMACQLARIPMDDAAPVPEARRPSQSRRPQGSRNAMMERCIALARRRGGSSKGEAVGTSEPPSCTIG